MPASKKHSKIEYHDINDCISSFNKAPESISELTISNVTFENIKHSITLKDLYYHSLLLEVQFPHLNALSILGPILAGIYHACREELSKPFSNLIDVKRFLVRFYKQDIDRDIIATCNNPNTALGALLQAMLTWDDVIAVHSQINLNKPLIVINSKPLQRSKVTKTPSLYMGKPPKHNRGHPYQTHPTTQTSRSLVKCSS